MISIVDPEAVNHVLRPTVYRAADAYRPTDANVDRPDERREPLEKAVEIQRVRERSDSPAGVV